MATSDIMPLKTALLQKRSRNRNQSLFSLSSIMSSWNARMISLYPSHIKYDTPEGKPKGIFALSAETKVLMSDIDNRHYSIKLVTEGEEFYMSCPDEATRQDWFSALKTVTDPAMIAEAMAEMAEKEKKRMSQITDEMRQAAIAEAYRAEQHAAAMAEKAETLKRMLHPTPCNKKLSTENKYVERYIWIEPDKNEFHWGKNSDYTFHSKAVNFKTHVKNIVKLSETSFALELADKEHLPEHLFREGFVFSSTAPTAIHIFIDDAPYCNKFIEIIKEMHETGTIVTE